MISIPHPFVVPSPYPYLKNLDSYLFDSDPSLYHQSEDDCDINRFESEDVYALAVGEATKWTDKAIYKAVSRGRFSPVNFHPAICDYRKNKDGRNRQIEQKTPLVWSPPGHGNTKPTCGSVSSVSTCLRGHEFHATLRHCWLMTCPQCFMDSATRKAREIDNKMTAFDDLNDGVPGTWMHLVLSPPQDLASFVVGSVEGYNLLIKWAGEIATELGVAGGVIVFHPWRQNGEDGSENSIVTGNTGDSLDWRLAPHIHMVGFGQADRIIKQSKENYKSTGWVVKVIGSDLENYRQAVIEYLLSHVGIASPIDPENPNRKSLRTFRLIGCINPNKLSKVHTSVETIPAQCPSCDGYLYPYPECLLERGEQYVSPADARIRFDFYVMKSHRSEVMNRIAEEHKSGRSVKELLVSLSFAESPMVSMVVSNSNRKKGDAANEGTRALARPFGDADPPPNLDVMR